MYTRREPIEHLFWAARRASMGAGAYRSLEMAELYLDNLARANEELSPREVAWAKLHSTSLIDKGAGRL